MNSVKPTSPPTHTVGFDVTLHQYECVFILCLSMAMGPLKQFDNGTNEFRSKIDKFRAFSKEISQISRRKTLKFKTEITEMFLELI